ncbi:MAG: hypothetical protein K9J42_15505 [Sulfuritalea sp.]|nr:hypothetical protein [Sulfuritalea sp.]
MAKVFARDSAAFLLRTFLCSLLVAFPVAVIADGDGITSAHYADPVSRYGHFAPGRPHEYARVEAKLRSGARLWHQLPDSEVFEDVRPRLVYLARNEPAQLLTIVSHRNQGAALVLLGVENNQLKIVARSDPIGTPMRWLNPVATADLDGDGVAEFAAIITPHISGTLKIFRRSGDKLREIAALDGFSNHVYGSSELGLSILFSDSGRQRLLIPDQSRTVLRIIEFVAGSLRETGRCILAARITGAIVDLGGGEVEITQGAGRQRLTLTNCHP